MATMKQALGRAQCRIVAKAQVPVPKPAAAKPSGERHMQGAARFQQQAHRHRHRHQAPLAKRATVREEIWTAAAAPQPGQRSRAGLAPRAARSAARSVVWQVALGRPPTALDTRISFQRPPLKQAGSTDAFCCACRSCQARPRRSGCWRSAGCACACCCGC